MARPVQRVEGTVWWITGLSGAGKSTVAALVRDALLMRGRSALLLDGDTLRQILAEESAHTSQDRSRLAMTYARLAREIAAQGLDAVCATVSMFHAVRDWNRANIPSYREIYLRVPMTEIVRRDSRGLYAGSTRGELSNVVGVDLLAEEPLSPDLVIDNFGEMSPEHAAERILALSLR